MSSLPLLRSLMVVGTDSFCRYKYLILYSSPIKIVPEKREEGRVGVEPVMITALVERLLLLFFSSSLLLFYQTFYDCVEKGCFNYMGLQNSIHLS